MAKSIPEKELQDIEAVVAAHPEGVGLQAVLDALEQSLPRRTLQYRLKYLVDAGRLIKTGEKRWVRYLPVDTERRNRNSIREPSYEEAAGAIPVSCQAAEIQAVLRKPLRSRKPAGYRHSFLNQYQPNCTAYLTPAERAHLREIGTPPSGLQPAGTYAKQILNRLLIDL